jgi:hypothetical protein
MAGASQQQNQKHDELARQQQQLRRDSRKAQDALRKHAKEHKHQKIAEHERAEIRQERKDNWLFNIARTAQQAFNRLTPSGKPIPLTPQQNLNQELEERLRQGQILGKATKGAAEQGRLEGVTSATTVGVDQEEQKLTMEQKREIRAQYIRDQKQQLKVGTVQEHVPMHQFLHGYRVVHGSGRPNVRSLQDQGLTLEEIKRIFEAYVISFFHEISLAASYLVRAYTQWVKGGHREDGRAPIGLFGEIVRQMQFSRGPAAFDDNDGKKKPKLSVVPTATVAVPEVQKAAYGT